MSTIKDFALYAAAFERAFESDDWTEIRSLLSPDVVYEIGLPILGAERCEGRDEMIAWFRESLESLDRRFDSRELALVAGPEIRDGDVWLSGTATYASKGLPPFVLKLEEKIRFENGLLVRLEDIYTDEMQAETKAYIDTHGDQIGLMDRTPAQSPQAN